jgi:hypothetical protein
MILDRRWTEEKKKKTHVSDYTGSRQIFETRTSQTGSWIIEPYICLNELRARYSDSL